ncbi:SDR family NAD(P)-dependent oxidoreductase [Microbacterium aoyamense]|uniref:SDR family NAD(P)-dependent oxidoreductase n=1 Tax=Microbacterium aoyamense TaxID=344166 RepID=A0ABP5B9I0_9MICO|nr:NAD(P)-dependent oxidoreductase [Microbacterium aoyamense]
MIGDVAGARIVVTGGAGLIGRPTVELLRQKRAKVVVFDRIASAVSGVESVVGDLRDDRAVGDVMANADAVVHLGGIPGPNLEDDVTTYEVNAVGTYSVFSAAARSGVQKVVYASSINVNGLPIGKRRAPTRIPYDETEPVSIADTYSLSKEANEYAARMAATAWGLQLTGLRFPLVRDLTAGNGAAFADHVRTALRLDPLRQAYEGWSYLHAGDAAQAVLCALREETPPAPGILVAASQTYLIEETREAAAMVIPDVPIGDLCGRDVGLNLERSSSLLKFQAQLLLEDLGLDLLASVQEGRR